MAHQRNSLLNLSSKCVPIVESFREKLHKKAEVSLSTTIPDQLDILEEMIRGDKIQSSYQVEVRQYCIETIGEFESKIEEMNKASQGKEMDMEQALKMLFGGGAAAVSKEETQDDNEAPTISAKNSKLSLGKRKRNVGKKSDGLTLESKDSNLSIELKLTDSAVDATNTKSSEKMAEEQEVPVIGINEKNYELAQMVKPVILALYDTCVLLRNWIILLIPKVEDGNNFGVEVQEQCLAQIKMIEMEMLQLIEEQAAYHLERATIISKLATSGEILDYKQYIYDADERHCRKLQDGTRSLRSSYIKLYRTITQNYDKITEPRGMTNHVHLY